LSIVEVCRNRDDGVGDVFAREVRSGFLHFRQNHCGECLGRIGAPTQPNQDVAVFCGFDHEGSGFRESFDFLAVAFAPDQTFDRVDGLLGVGRGLSFGDLTYELLTGIRKGDD